jgi:CHAT domain/SIR2-like domain
VTDYADLEIGLHRRDGVSWRVELRYSQSRSDVDTRLDSEGPLIAALNPHDLSDVMDDEDAYGRKLGQALLSGEIGAAFRQASAEAQSQGVILRVRLMVGPSAMPLHGVRWETLRDPRDGSRMLTDENIVFSRYLSSLDWRPVGLRPKSALRALAVIAGPSGLDNFDVGRDLAQVDVEQESQRAKDGLAPFATRVLAGGGAATIERLTDEVRDGCDILYLVCHGYLIDGEPVLVLEDEAGNAARVTGSSLVERLSDLPRLPRLVVLASCQSAGSGEDTHSDDGGALSGLGPELAEAGVPAVMAMQGDVSMTTIAKFMPVFFRELQRDGQVDRATAAARGAVRDRDDWWAPALFMRLRSGRIWYSSGFGQTADRFKKFPALVSEIQNQKCTPILGPGLTDPLLGSRQEIAQRWAKHFRFPMAPHYRDDLPQVAQYLFVDQGPEFPRDELRRYLRSALLDSYGDELPDQYRGARPEDLSIGRLISEAWQVRHPEGTQDPYAVLAELPIPLYVSAQPWNLLGEALRARGKDPRVEVCRWKRLEEASWWQPDPELDTPDWAFRVPRSQEEHLALVNAGWPTSVFDRGDGYRPDAQRPLVYHLFGHQGRPRSAVLTEDDYFDYLIGVTLDKDLVPYGVRRAFADSSLMFLGFRLDEWDFRVLYRSILSQEGNKRSKHTHVAVQIDPEEGRTLEPEGARRYLESYFGSDDITIYWGSTESFVKELRDAWVATS